ncbi:MAG: L-fucose isomerase [Clostridia bacterium]|nr:L-fucose isomerase [Clostridia bacterium]
MKGKIGIRPVNDGRDSVRYKIEEKTMKMAEAAKKIIEENVFYSDGTPVECVIASTTIACAAEAIRVEEEFARQGVTATLTVTPIFCFGTETIDMNPHTLKAVWGFNGTERPGAVYLACAMSAYNERNLPAFSIYGKDVQDLDDDSVPSDVKEKILLFAKAATAVAEMRNRSYISIGSVSMGIPGSFQEPMMLQNYLGMRAEWTDMSEVNRRIEKGIYDQEEYERALAWVKKYITEGEDFYNPPELRHNAEERKRDWEYSVKMAVIIKDIMQGNPRLAERGYYEESLGKGAIAAGFQGQRQWTDYLPNCDFAESILNSSFDWNGVRAPYIVATENDTLNGLTMLFQYLLTKQASVFADVRTYWSPEAIKRVTGKDLTGKAKNGFIHLNNSGAAALDGAAKMFEGDVPRMKQWWKVTKKDVEETLSAVTYHPANLEYFKAGGFSSHFVTREEMPVTMMRLNRIGTIGPVLQIVEGYTVALPKDISDAVEKRTDPAWPTTFFVPNLCKGGCDTVYDVMANWGANHSCITYGHIGAEAITLASMLRIPVSLHNVPSSRIFRPHVWSAYGKENEQSADFMACRDLGALYR